MATAIDYTEVEFHQPGVGRVSAYADRVLYGDAGIYLVSLVAQNSVVRALLAALVTGKEVTVRVFKEGRETDCEYLRAAGKGTLFLCRQRDGYAHGAFIARSCLLDTSSEQEGDEIAGQVILDDQPEEILAQLMRRMTLTALPQWAPWLVERLYELGRLVRLSGGGIHGVLLVASERQLDEVLSEGVQQGALAF